MVTAIRYNCSPDSLAGIAPEESARVEVTFRNAASGLESVSSTDDADDVDRWDDVVSLAAERAFHASLSA